MKPPTKKVTPHLATLQCIALLGLLLLSGEIHAATFTWDGGGGDDNWSTAANWNPDGAPANDGTADIVMAGTVRLTPNVDAAWDVLGLTFDNTAGAFTLGGSQLTIRGSGITNNSTNLQTIGNNIVLNVGQTWNAASGDILVSGIVSGSSVTLTKSGTGTVVLSGVNTYSGSTTISAGRLTVNNGSGSGTGTGAVTVGASGTLSGSGIASGAVTLNGTVEPGVNTGTLITGAEYWERGGHYIWEINKADGTKGTAIGWDWLNSTGGIRVNATASNEFTIHITSLNLSNVSGQAANFDNTQSYTWTIATANNGFDRYAANKFIIDASAFQNPTNGGTFSLVKSNNDLALRFTPGSTTLGNGTDPANVLLPPGGAATMADAFTFRTTADTDTITGVAVTLAAGTSGGLSLVVITNDAGTVVYGSVTNPGSDTPAITLSTNITATTTATQYKIRVTPKSHSNMPVPAGSTYSVTARISDWTGTNTHAGSDVAGTTVTIDNLSPGNVTAATATPGGGQVALAWTNPVDADLDSIVVLRRTASAVTDMPVEGMTYSVGETIGSSTVACVVTAPAASCADTGLDNGTAYYYKIFALDNKGNYATGVVPTGSPATPFGAPIITVSKLSSVISDPVNNTTNPKRIPRSVIEFTISPANSGTASPDANSTYITDVIDNATMAFDVTSGVTFSDGVTTSQLTLDTVSYSNTASPGPYVFSYTPVPDGQGYDVNVTAVKISTTGSFAYGGSPNASFTIRFRVKLQ